MYPQRALAQKQELEQVDRDRALFFTDKNEANRHARNLMRAGYCVSMQRDHSAIRMSGWDYTVWIEE